MYRVFFELKNIDKGLFVPPPYENADVIKVSHAVRCWKAGITNNPGSKKFEKSNDSNKRFETYVFFSIKYFQTIEVTKSHLSSFYLKSYFGKTKGGGGASLDTHKVE